MFILMLWSFVSFLGVSIELIWNILFVQVLLNGSIVFEDNCFADRCLQTNVFWQGMGSKTSFQYKYIVDWIPITLLMYGRKITEREREVREFCVPVRCSCMKKELQKRERTMERWLRLKPWYFGEPSKT